MTQRRRDITPPSTPPAVFPLDPTGMPGLNEALGGGIQQGPLAIAA